MCFRVVWRCFLQAHIEEFLTRYVAIADCVKFYLFSSCLRVDMWHSLLSERFVAIWYSSIPYLYNFIRHRPPKATDGPGTPREHSIDRSVDDVDVLFQRWGETFATLHPMWRWCRWCRRYEPIHIYTWSPPRVHSRNTNGELNTAVRVNKFRHFLTCLMLRQDTNIYDVTVC